MSFVKPLISLSGFPGTSPLLMATSEPLLPRQMPLRLNGYRAVGDGVEFAKQLEAVAERTGSLEDATDEFERWLSEHTIELKR